VASALHAADPRFGLLGQRGNPNQIARDCVTYLLDPAKPLMVAAWDICGSCGGSNPSIVFNEITDYKSIGNAGTAIWVRPAGSVVTPPPPPPVDPVAPPADLAPVLAALATLTDKVDAVAALALAARDAALDAKAEAEQAKVNASDIKHVSLPALLEELKTTAHPCYRGRVSGWAAGSLQLCPAP